MSVPEVIAGAGHRGRADPQNGLQPSNRTSPRCSAGLRTLPEDRTGGGQSADQRPSGEPLSWGRKASLPFAAVISTASTRWWWILKTTARESREISWIRFSIPFYHTPRSGRHGIGPFHFLRADPGAPRTDQRSFAPAAAAGFRSFFPWTAPPISAWSGHSLHRPQRQVSEGAQGQFCGRGDLAVGSPGPAGRRSRFSGAASGSRYRCLRSPSPGIQRLDASGKIRAKHPLLPVILYSTDRKALSPPPQIKALPDFTLHKPFSIDRFRKSFMGWGRQRL